MGIFGDSFNKSFKDVFKTGGLPSSKSETLARRATRHGGSLMSGKAPSNQELKSEFKGLNQAGQGAVGEALSPAAASTLGPMYHAVRDDVLNPGGGSTPPPVGGDTGVGAGDSEAVRRSRIKAIADARARRAGSQTVTTTPLGTTAKAATSKKKLLGE